MIDDYLELAVVHVEVDRSARLQLPIDARIRVNDVDEVSGKVKVSDDKWFVSSGSVAHSPVGWVELPVGAGSGEERQCGIES